MFLSATQGLEDDQSMEPRRMFRPIIDIGLSLTLKHLFLFREKLQAVCDMNQPM